MMLLFYCCEPASRCFTESDLDWDVFWYGAEVVAVPLLLLVLPLWRVVVMKVASIVGGRRRRRVLVVCGGGLVLVGIPVILDDIQCISKNIWYVAWKNATREIE